MSTLSGLSYEQVLARAEGGRARLAHRRWRRDLLRPRAQADRAGQGAGGELAGGQPGRARARDPDPLHDALRPRRDARGASRAPASPARAPGRDGRVPGLRPLRRPSREHPARLGSRPPPPRPTCSGRSPSRACCSTTSPTSRPTGSRWACRWRRSRSISVPTTSRARSGASRSSTQPAPAPRPSRTVERLVALHPGRRPVPVERDTLYNELRRWDTRTVDRTGS